MIDAPENRFAPGADARGSSPRVEVLSGLPTSEELAAVVIAVKRLAAERRSDSTSESPTGRWQRAALEEGVSGKAEWGARWSLPLSGRNG